MRDLNNEFQDASDRKYAYDFDYILRDFIVRTLQPHFVQGKTLEMGCFEGVFTKTLTGFFKDLTVIEGSTDLKLLKKKNTWKLTMKK